MTRNIADKGAVWPVSPAFAPPKEVVTLDPGRMVRALRRQWLVILVTAVIGATVALLLALGTVSRYQAMVTILLDEERSELLQQVSALPNAVVTDAAIQSEMEIIRSRALALAVVDALSLDEDPQFLNPPTDGTARFMGTIRGAVQPVLDLLSPPAQPEPGAEVSDQDPAAVAREEAASLLLRQIAVERIERSFVMRVTYTGYDPQLAARIARTYGEAYMRFQLSSTTEVAINAGRWIRERLDLIERSHIEAASAVQRFRLENNLLEARGNLLTEQQQSELATALVTAATETAALRAQLQSYEGLLSASAGEMAAVAAMNAEDDTSDPLIQLRREYAETRRNLSRVVVQAGEDHPQATSLRAALEGLEAEIALALEGTVAAIRTRYNIAQSRETSLREEIAGFTEARRGNETVLGRLAQLEAISQTYATVYADYLLRFETTTQQQGFPIASVQILSDAEVPRDPSSPRRLRMLATGLFLGGLIGLMIAAVREMRTRPLRTSSEVISQCGLPCVGLMPRNASAAGRSTADRVAMRTAKRIRQEIERKSPLTKGRFVGLAPVDEGGDMGSVIALLCQSLMPRTGRVKIVDAGGLSAVAKGKLQDIDNIEISTFAALAAALFGDKGSAQANIALSEWREEWPLTLIVMPPLTRAVIADPMTSILDATVLTIAWGTVSPGLVIEAMQDHRDFRAALATTVLDGAHLRQARRFMDPKEYEARLINA